MLMQQLNVRKIPAVQPAIDHTQSLHVAIISDGNGRWATSRGLPRSAGHRAGAEAARRVIEAAPRLGIHTLTLFALSSANWKRPAAEVNAILRLLHEYLFAETTHCIDEGVFADSNRRRAAALGLSFVGMRFRRIGFYAKTLARLRCRRS